MLPKTAKKDLLKAIKVLLPKETIDILTKSKLADLSTDQINMLFSAKTSQELTPLFCLLFVEYGRKRHYALPS